MVKIKKLYPEWFKKKDLSGRKFGKLTVVKFLYFKEQYEKGKRKSFFLCKCDCGKEKIATGNQLQTNHVKSCGCLVIPKYKINEKYFVKIDTKDKAYFFGLILTDGAIRKQKSTKSLYVSLDKKDEDILKTFKKYLKTDKPLKYYKRPPRKYSYHSYPSSESCTLAISNVKIYDDLIKLGIYPNKTKTVDFPNNKRVPDKYLGDFIRGVFDGDGTAVKKKYKTFSRQVAITSGSKLFLRKFSNFLHGKGINNTVTWYNRKLKSGKNTSYGVINILARFKNQSSAKGSISQQGLNQKKFYDFIYNKCPNDLYIKRKHKSFTYLISPN